MSPVSAGETFTKIIFHSGGGGSDFGKGNAAVVQLPCNVRKMSLLMYFVSSTKYRRNYLPALFFSCNI